METKDPKQQPAFIIEQDVMMSRKLGKFIMENAEWKGLSTMEMMEVYQLLMWYNTVPKKFEDNIMEPTAYKEFSEEELQATAPEPKKKASRKKK